MSSSSSSSSKNVRLAEDVRFDVFCRFLENVNRTKRKKDKLDILWGFLRPISDSDCAVHNIARSK